MACTYLFGVVFLIILDRGVNHVQSHSLADGDFDQRFIIWDSTGGLPLLTAYSTQNFTVRQSNLPHCYRVYGLWTMEQCNPTECFKREIIPKRGGCTPIEYLDGTTKLRLIRFGAANTFERSMTFYSEPDFLGIATQVGFYGSNFTAPLWVRSYFFTSDNFWVYEDATGANNCLPLDADVAHQGFGHSFDLDSDLEVMSIYEVYRCSPNPSTTTQVSTTTLKLSSTTTSGSTTSTVKTTTILSTTTKVTETSTRKSGGIRVYPSFLIHMLLIVGSLLCLLR